MNIGDKAYFYSSRILPFSRNVAFTGTIVDKFHHPDYPDDDGMAKFKIRLDRKIWGLFPAYEWVRGGEIFGVKDMRTAELERIAKL